MEKPGTEQISISLFEYHQDWLDNLRSKAGLMPRSTFIQFVIWRLHKCLSPNADICTKLQSPNLEAELEQMKQDGKDFLRVKQLKAKLEVEGEV